MQLAKELLKIDGAKTEEGITRFIANHLAECEARGIVLGISGGVDSATTAALVTSAIGPDKTICLYMPEEETYSNIDREHIKDLAGQLKFQMETIDLSKPLSTLYRAIPNYNPEHKLCRGNLKARMRMLVLYYYANCQNLLVASSSDKSETMIGYFTKWGDGAADIAPIRGLYKTQVRELALHLALPPHIVEKPSTPGLWPNQTAESEIGLEYQPLT
jgi:NAD+ synthase